MIAAPSIASIAGTSAALPSTKGRRGSVVIDEYGYYGSRPYRSKRKPTRRVPRSNRLHVSRRVRRKHRRSKAA